MAHAHDLDIPLPGRRESLLVAGVDRAAGAVAAPQPAGFDVLEFVRRLLDLMDGTIEVRSEPARERA